MKYIADLHIHSRYSRATSKASHLHGLAAWAAIKGVHVVGTGDFTHPAWFAHLQKYLEPAEPGFYRLKPVLDINIEALVPAGIQPRVDDIRFVLTAEISSIYKRGGRVRKVHNILIAPDFSSVQRINMTLAGIGNLESDGRPILGLDSRDLLAILLDSTEDGFLVPAHIWTPWFSLFGSKSGFDSLEECFGDLSHHVFAVETGLSSDPEMNRHISALDHLTCISNSDCHSPGKLGREANIFTTGFDYYSMREAIRNPVDEQGKQVFSATIEFYPEEGKYHCDGHRKCGVCFEPGETIEHNGICPVCGKPMTIGVFYRVMELADRKEAIFPSGSPAVFSLVPLVEIISEIVGVGPASKKVTSVYSQLMQRFGSELDLLLNVPLEDIEENASAMLAEAIRRVREGRVIRQAGFDGQFGVIRVFHPEEQSQFAGQGNLFGTTVQRPKVQKKVFQHIPVQAPSTPSPVRFGGDKVNEAQRAAIESDAGHVLVQAGPGTGKTYTLVKKVVRIVATTNAPCVVITFTNRAADELRQRLNLELPAKHSVFVATFHGYCLHWLRQKNPNLQVIGPDMRMWILGTIFFGRTVAQLADINQQLTAFLTSKKKEEKSRQQDMRRYFSTLDAQQYIDIEAIIPCTVQLLRQNREFSRTLRAKTAFLFIDEFQDLNQVQYDLVRLLATTAKIFAIGDPDQAIYGFRGSDPQWFFHFIHDQKPQQFTLIRNYRSAPLILAAAHQVIRHNSTKTPVGMEAQQQSNGTIYVQQCSDSAAEARFVCDQITQLVGGTSHRDIERFQKSESGSASLGDIAVLARTAKQQEEVARIMAKRGLPFQRVALTPFYREGETQVLYEWTLLASGHAEYSEVLRLLEREHGIGKKSLRIFAHAAPDGCDDVLDRLAEQARQHGKPRLQRVLNEYQSMCSRFQKEATQESILAALGEVVDHYALDRQDLDLQRFFHLAASFGSSLDIFAEHLQRYSDSVIYDDRADAVALLTMHAAKGLEFPVVFMVGLEEGLMPLATRESMSDKSLRCHIEEERRLFFVGVTRATETLFLSSARRRRVHGTEQTQQSSRFLAEIDTSLFTRPPEVRPFLQRKGKHFRQLSLFSDQT